MRDAAASPGSCSAIAKRLLPLTGGHPYETMRTANHMGLQALLRGAAEAAEGDGRLAFEDTLGEIHNLWAERWERAGRVRQAPAAMKSRAAGAAPMRGAAMTATPCSAPCAGWRTREGSNTPAAASGP